MNAIQQFNTLNNKVVTRIELEKIINQAKHENAVDVVYRISKILNENPNTEEFEINITEFEIEPISPTFLAGIPFEEINEESVGLSGLAAAVSPDQIYTMVTQKMLEMMKKASGKGYKKAWGNKNNEGLYSVPYNFVSKKPYQGINFFMLKNGDIFSYLENPYFLTFKQIENLGGKLKKGSEGYEVIYYTNLYLVKKEGKTIFGAYNYEKIKNYLKENNLSEDDVRKYPILKYYNVFNGKDIEGIDFKLEKSAVPVVIQPEENENPYGESIVKYYPTCPRITHGGDKAFYHPARDFIQLPKKENFDTSNDYFRTLFHEMAHSTGHEKRLNRDLSGSFGSKKYAFEELIAEFTSVFVSAHAGIVWYGNKNHAEYLKNWSKVIGEMEKDNKFVVKAAAQAQKAANYILDCNENGEPAFYKDFFKEEKKKNLYSTEKQEKRRNKKEKEKKQVKKADKETEKIFVKLLLPLYVERKNNPQKFTGHNDDSPENFRVEDADFWAKFTDVNTDLFKTKASKKLVKITEKGFEVLEKEVKKSQGNNQPKKNAENIIAQPFEENKHFKNKGLSATQLLAPNGKPSNLTPKQYKMVRTEAFKNWFGDWENDPENASKVVDENGEPLVVYHGTAFDFDVFNSGGKAFGKPVNYFSTKKSIAKSYGEKIIPAFLNIREFDREHDAEGKTFNEWTDQKGGVGIPYRALTHSCFVIRNIKDHRSGNKKNVAISDVYAVGDDFAHNIKHATDNNGDFDANNPSFLAGVQIPFFENLKDAKKYFLAWALKHLRGKKVYHKELEKWVLFNRVGIEHTLSNRISLEKMTLILQAENMLKKSQLIKFEEENKGRTNIKGVYRMRSVGVVEGEEKEVIITLREGENGVIYYDHKVEIKNPLSTRKSSARPKNLLDNGFSDRKITKKSESSKQKPKKSGLGLPLTDEIRKKAFTEKGKLRKGWYYEENGLLTNGKDFYIKDLEYAQEYNAIERKIARRNNPKSKELSELFIKKNDKENEYYREQRGIIIDDLLRKYDIKNKVDFRYFFIDKFVIKDELRKLAYINRGEENKRMRAFKDFAKEINKDKFGFTYSLTPKGEEILSEYLEKEKELYIKAHGNPKKIKKKYGLSAPSSPTPPKEGLTPLSLGEAVSESEEVVG